MRSVLNSRLNNTKDGFEWVLWTCPYCHSTCKHCPPSTGSWAEDVASERPIRRAHPTVTMESPNVLGATHPFGEDKDGNGFENEIICSDLKDKLG